jgi:hypothetical protein
MIGLFNICAMHNVQLNADEGRVRADIPAATKQMIGLFLTAMHDVQLNADEGRVRADIPAAAAAAAPAAAAAVR